MIFSWVPFGVVWNGQQAAWPDRGVPEWSEKMRPNDYKDSMRRRRDEEEVGLCRLRHNLPDFIILREEIQRPVIGHRGINYGFFVVQLKRF